MSAIASCSCADPACARCGRAAPVVVWGDDPPESDRPPPRTDPPRPAEAAALALYERVAARPKRIRRRFHRRGIIRGAGLLAASAIVYYFDWDISLLRLVSIAFAGFGLVRVLQGLLGYGR
jgi:hypothetical protein